MRSHKKSLVLLVAVLSWTFVLVPLSHHHAILAGDDGAPSANSLNCTACLSSAQVLPAVPLSAGPLLVVQFNLSLPDAPLPRLDTSRPLSSRAPPQSLAQPLV